MTGDVHPLIVRTRTVVGTRTLVGTRTVVGTRTMRHRISAEPDCKRPSDLSPRKSACAVLNGKGVSGVFFVAGHRLKSLGLLLRLIFHAGRLMLSFFHARAHCSCIVL